jgi:hypothetical protein
MKPYMAFIFGIFYSQLVCSQDIVGSFKIKKAIIVIAYRHAPVKYYRQSRETDSSIVIINDHILIIPVDSVVINMSDAWVKKTEIDKISYQMKTADYLRRKCTLEMENLFHNRWLLKIGYRSFFIQYEFSVQPSLS